MFNPLYYLPDVLSRQEQTESGEVVAAKVAIPGVGDYAGCKDTEGKILGIMEDEPSAK